jgi:hypothetical protein
MPANSQYTRTKPRPSVNAFGEFVPSCECLDAAAALIKRRRMAEALDAYNVAEKHGHARDKCAAGRWVCWMLMGDFERAWLESDLIDGCENGDPNRLWDGTAFDGKTVLLRTLHGYGDAIQFIRYAPLIRRRARKLIVQTHPEMMHIVQCVEGIDETITWPDAPSDGVTCDQQIEIMELPRVFRSTVSSIPAQLPYVSLDRIVVETSQTRLAATSRPKIGLLWAASQYDPARSLHLEQLSPLLNSCEFEFYSFQRGPEREELDSVRNRFRIHDTAQHSFDIMDTAADLTNMDLIVSVDSFVAHLAGALGRPVYLMLAHAADWRWMLGRQDSPWYPTMRLFRQSAPGEWGNVISDLVRQLANSRIFRKL